MDDFTRWLMELQSPQVDERVQAAERLAGSGPEAVVVAVELVRACADEDETVRNLVVEALENLGPPQPEQQSQLIELLSTDDPLVTYWAATLLGRLGPSAATSQTALAAVLSESPNLAARERAAWALGKIGPTSDDAVAALKLADDPGQPRLARLAREALSSSQN